MYFSIKAVFVKWNSKFINEMNDLVLYKSKCHQMNNHYQYTENISSRFVRISEAFISEFLQNLKCFLITICIVTFIPASNLQQHYIDYCVSCREYVNFLFRSFVCCWRIWCEYFFNGFYLKSAEYLTSSASTWVMIKDMLYKRSLPGIV